MSEGQRNLFARPMPEGYRKELQALVAVEPPKHARRVGTVLLIQLGQMYLALPTKVAVAVSPVLHIARIPHRSGTVLLGLVAFRGEIIPCCSLATLLDVARNETGAARMLMLEETPGRLWAVPIDAMVGIHTTAEIHAPESAPLSATWFSGTFEHENRDYYLLDHANLFRQITLATA
jgi:chemotaxis-related protein WspD